MEIRIYNDLNSTSTHMAIMDAIDVLAHIRILEMVVMQLLK